MILLADHQDSFTRNLEHLLAGFDEVLVLDRREIDEPSCRDADMIVFSPGPGNPDQYPETQAICREWTGKKPILGICLGFQLILQVEGARITRQSQVLHGVETEIEFDPSSKTYSGLPPSLRVARYHSLRVDPTSLGDLPDSISITGRDPLRDAPLSFEDTKRKLFGLQYHPESFLTTAGHSLIENIRHACMD
jgi:anthranilate synthase/aminodeoxychorismate synthase-like glutamine amidotransferase